MKHINLLAIALLVPVFMAGPLLASENAKIQSSLVGSEEGDGISLHRISYSAIKTANVRLLVEIPESKLIFRHHLEVAEGSTVSQVLEKVYEVKHGVVCCDSRDIFAINGLAVDPYKEKWWVIKVNGNTQNTSSTRKLVEGDLVELVYLENALYPVAHVRLEEWVSERGASK